MQKVAQHTAEQRKFPPNAQASMNYTSFRLQMRYFQKNTKKYTTPQVQRNRSLQDTGLPSGGSFVV